MSEPGDPRFGSGFGFVFDWQRPALSLRLPWFLLASLLAHLFGFYAFQIVYPSSTALLPAAASVTVLDSNQDRDRRILDWAQLEDPAALTAPGFRPELVRRLVPRYGPSFADPSSAFLPITPEPTDPQFPSIFGPDGILAKNPAPALPAPVVFKSGVELGEALRDRLAAPLPALPALRAYAQNTVLLVGIGPSGAIACCLTWRSSGQPELDQAAERFTRGLHFRAAPGYAWGEIRVTWGYDAP
ncbi:MAG: hypothetical protein JO069_22380 [Verrucomicrobia bacterium]|nr:hypothetical protein [Verrucomicrobiota bacterium]